MKPLRNTPPRLPRRRVISMIAAAGGLPLIAGPSMSRQTESAPVVEWRGRALGAQARLLLAHPRRNEAERAVARCVAEVTRLETIFSLYRQDSLIFRLNRTGRLAAPPLDMRLLLAEARRFGALTGGAFDVTVQPLWRAFADHFTHTPDAPPKGHAFDAARRLVDYRGLEIGPDLIAFAYPGMAVTLNGIAQGYISDRVGDLLRDMGFERVLVDLGETLAVGPPDGSRPWRIGIRDPAHPGALAARLELANAAAATSSGGGLAFDESGRHHHVLDPARGSSPSRHAAVTVLAGNATTADALATALLIMPSGRARALLALLGAEAVVQRGDGGIEHWDGRAQRPLAAARPIAYRGLPPAA